MSLSTEKGKNSNIISRMNRRMTFSKIGTFDLLQSLNAYLWPVGMSFFFVLVTSYSDNLILLALIILCGTLLPLKLN